MPDPVLLAVIVTAIAIGWGLGRLSRPSRAAQRSKERSATYHQGLNYLINEQPDRAVDAFIEVMEVNLDTLETHLSLGNLLRRRGEVDGAIRVHQNLLSRPSLPAGQQHKVLLELARDYIKAGLFDRAERLLRDLVEDSSELCGTALTHLVEIYQEERDWRAALVAGKRLLPRRLLRQRSAREVALASAMAHYCCELAGEADAANDWREARRQIRRAFSYDQDCVRATLLQADGLFRAERPRQALKVLQRIPLQNPVFLVECLGLAQHCFDALGDRSGHMAFLERQVAEHSGSGILLRLVDCMRQQQLSDDAIALLVSKLREHPSMRGVVELIRLYRDTAEGAARYRLDMVESLLQTQLEGVPDYRCNHCGFSGNQLHWQCPSCHRWGGVEPLAGLTGRQPVTAMVGL